MTPPFTVHADVSITRRKHFHLIEDAEGEIVWRSRLFGEIVEWLAAQEQAGYTLIVEGQRWHIAMRPLADEEEVPQ